MPSDVVLPLLTKITAPAQCKKGSSGNYINLFSDEFNYGYYEVEIDLKQIDPTIQSISKFQDAYKTIEISNLDNLQVECGPPEIENFIPNINVDLTIGNTSCNFISGLLSDLTLQQSGLSQTDKVNFDNIITLYTDNIKNDIQTFVTAYTNGLSSDNYQNIYKTKSSDSVKFLLQITKLSNNDNGKITETYLQAYYTNDLKLKIRFSKILFSQLFLGSNNLLMIYFGNDKDIKINIYNSNVLGIINKSDNPFKITIKPR
ncbi:MAG: hypothetical protein OHM56_00600 [Spiroplasma phoeniceum]|nr:MAG: hypothetical protein OHM57_00005 [Spiroplasma phoeniceum]UZQ32521.1 MAG: hypothetical protein OHM56_00600 [Spiroplasma phoeniceum]